MVLVQVQSVSGHQVVKSNLILEHIQTLSIRDAQGTLPLTCVLRRPE